MPASNGVTGAVRTAFNLLTAAGINALNRVPVGGAAGIFAAAALVWFAPELRPEGWSVEAILSVGLVAGLVVHRVVEWLIGWFLEPARRHLGARWDAHIRLEKLEHYRDRGLLKEDEAVLLTSKIVQDDITSKQRRR